MAQTKTIAAKNEGSYLISLTIIWILFFIFEFVTWLNGSLIPFLHTACELTLFQASLVTLLGIANAMMWPALCPLALNSLGK
jgi:FHS family L-fucose permease-like MFS transporter